MFKLLVILFIIKMYARNSIFKRRPSNFEINSHLKQNSAFQKRQAEILSCLFLVQVLDLKVLRALTHRSKTHMLVVVKQIGPQPGNILVC